MLLAVWCSGIIAFEKLVLDVSIDVCLVQMTSG